MKVRTSQAVGLIQLFVDSCEDYVRRCSTAQSTVLAELRQDYRAFDLKM